MRQVGKSVPRVDSFDKVTGRTKYCGDLVPKNALIVKIKHAEIAHGYVTAVDIAAAQAIPGVVRILTCFDVPDRPFPTAGHPWSTDPAHQDVADRLLLNRHVRYYGDEVAAVVATDEVAAMQAVRAIKVEYEALPFVLDPVKAMEAGQPQLHAERPNNILGHSCLKRGDYEAAIQEPGLTMVEGWYDTPTVQHCHIENHICCAYEENGRLVVLSSTQIPHIIRRCVGQALGIPWGKVRVIKPYIGGGFGNKQDALYEPLCAWLSTQVGGRPVKLDVSREETFVNNRVRHAIRSHIISWVRQDGSLAARKLECFSDQGAYASHGHGVVAKGMGCFHQLYPCENVEGEAWTVFTNKAPGGAMRGYGIPQAMFAVEAHTDDICRKMGLHPLRYREKYLMPKGYVDAHSKNENYADSFRECLQKGREYLNYDEKYAAYQNQTGPVRRGVGCAAFWYNTAVWPLSLESASCRMVLNQDGSIQLQVGETEIGQGADTVFAQMAAEELGIDYRDVHVVSCQDTDVTPFGTGAYASRQTYAAGFAIRQTAGELKKEILDYACGLTRQAAFNLEIKDAAIVRTTDGRVLLSLAEVATEALYSMTNSRHLHAETTFQIRNNAYTFGCCFTEVEVDIPLCKVRLLDIINVHDCGRLINPALAEAQVHGGMSMGIGYALSEQLIYDAKTGRALNNNLLDYKLSTVMDHPHLEAQFIENAEPTSAYGTKGLGEPPACPVAPAIRNAVLQATGVFVNRIPMTPQVFFSRFREEGLI